MQTDREKFDQILAPLFQTNCTLEELAHKIVQSHNIQKEILRQERDGRCRDVVELQKQREDLQRRVQWYDDQCKDKMDSWKKKIKNQRTEIGLLALQKEKLKRECQLLRDSQSGDGRRHGLTCSSWDYEGEWDVWGDNGELIGEIQHRSVPHDCFRAHQVLGDMQRRDFPSRDEAEAWIREYYTAEKAEQ